MDAEKNIRRWQGFLNSPGLSDEDLMILENGSIDQVLGIIRRLEIEDPFSLIRAREDYLASREITPPGKETEDAKPEQTERRLEHRRSQHLHPAHEEPKEEAGKAAQAVSAGNFGDQNWGISEPGQSTVVTERRVNQPRTGGYPNRRRGGFINRANRLAARAGRTRRPSLRKKAVRSLEKKALISVLPLIGALIPLFFVIIVFVVIMGSLCSGPLGFIASALGMPCSQAPAPKPGPGPEPGPGPGQIPECDQIVGALSDKFGISLKEGAPPPWVFGGTFAPDSLNCTTEKGIYKTFAIAMQSQKYEDKIKSRSITLQFFRGNLGGVTSYGDLIQLQGAVARYNACDYNSSCFYDPATWITHETGHIIQQRSAVSLDNDFGGLLDWAVHSDQSKDKNCYEYRSYQGGGGWFMKTYSRSSSGISNVRESMAEAIALFVYNHKKSDFGTEISDFKNQCPATYNWTRTNIYDYDFN